MHEHFDANDIRTGYTVVTRESAWDESSRGRALRLAEYDASFCSCGCGQPLEIARDNTIVFVVDEVKCHARRALDKVSRERRETAEKLHGPGWDDGLHFTVRPHDPDRDKPLPTQRPRGERS